jgi:hypothetical protein
MLDDATKKKIYDSYIKGEGSIQGIANFYRVTVDQVLTIIGQDELKTVTTPGDMIDEDEAGTEPIKSGQTHRVRYDPS